MFKSLKNFIGMGSADSENLSVDESNLKNQTDNSPNYSTKNNTIPTDKTQYLPKSSSYTSYFKNPFSNKQQKDKNKWGTESEDSQGDSNMGYVQKSKRHGSKQKIKGTEADNNRPNTSSRNIIRFVTTRPSNLLIDEDLIEGQEFYYEAKIKNSKNWTLRKIAKRHLRHLEFVKLDKPSIGFDCFTVLLPVERLPKTIRG